MMRGMVRVSSIACALLIALLSCKSSGSDNASTGASSGGPARADTPLAVDLPSSLGKLESVDLAAVAELLPAAESARQLAPLAAEADGKQAVVRLCYDGMLPRDAAREMAEQLEASGWYSVNRRGHPTRSEVALAASNRSAHISGRFDDGDGGARCGAGNAFAELRVIVLKAAQ